MIRAKYQIVNKVSLARIWRDTVDQAHFEKPIAPTWRDNGAIKVY
jgi:hypothetical protein